MSDLQIKYVARNGPTHGSITEVGGDGWRASKADVIGLLKNHTNTYFTRVGSARAQVRVVNGPSGEYLQSARNGVPNDNLLSLPGFPESSSPAGGLTEDILAALKAQIAAELASGVIPQLQQLIDARVKPIEARFAAYGTRIGANEKSLSLHGARAGNIEQGLRTLGVRLESAEQALGSTGTRIESSNQALSSQAARLVRLEARPKVCVGEVVLPEASALASGSGDRDWSARVNLPAGMFGLPPQIATSLYRVEFEATRNVRIHIEANNVTAAGFDLRCMTWLDTRISTAAVQWIAIGS